MASSPAIEEYLQAVYTLADEGTSVIGARLAAFMGVSAAAVSEMVHRLERDGLVSLDGRKEVHLTESGQRLADSIIRRHRLAERMLVDLLGYEWWKTHEEAERIEHAMSPEMEERLVRVLGDPQTCRSCPGASPRERRRTRRSRTRAGRSAPTSSCSIPVASRSSTGRISTRTRSP